MEPRLEYAVSTSGELRESHKAASLTAAAFTVSLHSGTLRKVSASLSRSAIMKVYPGKYTDRNSGEGLKDETFLNQRDMNSIL